MKTAESKTTTTAATTAAKTPTSAFFSQEPQGTSAFFGGEAAEAAPFFSPRTIQPKLTIGAPNDKYEQQADAVADQAVAKLNAPTPSVKDASKSASWPSLQAKCDRCAQEEKLQKKEILDSGAIIQRQNTSVPENGNGNVGDLPAYRFVDAFSNASYNLDYRAEGGNLSKWLQLTYRDGVVIDINIDEISDTAIDPTLSIQMLRDATLGRGGRIFPTQLNATTTPNLLRAKRSAIETMEEYNYEFMLAALPAVLFIIFTAAGTMIRRPTRTTPRLPRIRGTTPTLNPTQMGRLIGEEVKAMTSGKRAAIATRVSGLRLSQQGAAEATNAASQAAFGRTIITPLADGTTAVASVQAGPGQPIFVIASDGVVQAARATISVGRDLVLRITDIVIGL